MTTPVIIFVCIFSVLFILVFVAIWGLVNYIREEVNNLHKKVQATFSRLDKHINYTEGSTLRTFSHIRNWVDDIVKLIAINELPYFALNTKVTYNQTGFEGQVFRIIKCELLPVDVPKESPPQTANVDSMLSSMGFKFSDNGYKDPELMINELTDYDYVYSIFNTTAGLIEGVHHEQLEAKVK